LICNLLVFLALFFLFVFDTHFCSSKKDGKDVWSDGAIITTMFMEILA